jgi:hypothetical protein
VGLPLHAQALIELARPPARCAGYRRVGIQ